MAESLRREKTSSNANRQAVVCKVRVVVTSGTVRARVRSPSGGSGIFRVRLVGMALEQFGDRYAV